MAKGGNNQSSNGSRFMKSYSASNSFVTKVASRVSDYLGGWFGTPLKRSHDAEETEATPAKASGDTAEKRFIENVDARRSTFLPPRIFDDAEALSSPAKRFKVSDNEKVDIDFPISPIPGTSGLFQSTNHIFDGPKGDEFRSRGPGPSRLVQDSFHHATDAVTQNSSASDIKANGATDNHSDSSESTSGCSSLVPQSDRLSQTVYVGSVRKRNLEKLKYARQLQHSRLYLNRSIPVTDAPSARKKPSFDVSVYGSSSVDKSFLREKLINSPFYTGQTSYGGASAFRLSRSAFFSQRHHKTTSERREGMQVQVKPSHHGSTEDLSNMSHTAKKILEALEQFSTPVNDAKRIPVGRANVPLGAKKRRCDESSEVRLTLATPISPLNPNPGPVITGLNVPTVPDLLKLKRLERIQNSTAAARQVAIKEKEYRLPSDKPPAKRTGKIVTKLKNKEKSVPLEKLEEVNLPKIPLPITTLPKFDFQLPVPAKPAEGKAEKNENLKSRNFAFSLPISISVQELPKTSTQKKHFTFSRPLNAGEMNVSEPKLPSSLVSFMSSEAVAKLKRKSIGEGGNKSAVPPAPIELNAGSVIDFLTKNANAKETTSRSASETWECTNCLIRNINDSKICQGCKTDKVLRTSTSPTLGGAAAAEAKTAPVLGFGDKFKPPTGSWSCKECFVSNDAAAIKCIACETPKQHPPSTAKPPEEPSEPPPAQPLPAPARNGFGDIFKKQADQWECSVCMIRNKELDMKCAACETPKPGAPVEKAQPKFTFGMPSGGPAQSFKFGIDRGGGAETLGVKSAADSSTFKLNLNGSQSEPPKGPSQFNTISTSIGVFTFGIPPMKNEKEEPKPESLQPPKTADTSGSFLVTSTSGFSSQKENAQVEKKADVVGVADTKDVRSSDPPKLDFAKPFIFGTTSNSASKPVEDNRNEPNESKPPATLFSASSNSAASETVSSSTADFFAHSKPADSLSFNAPLPTPQTSSFAPPPNALNPDPRPGDGVKSESAVSTSAPAATAAQLFSSSPSAPGFNAPPKITFGTASATSGADLKFGTVATSTPPVPLFGHSASFSGPAFPSCAPPSTTSFGMVPRAPEKTTAFGGGSTSFCATPSFASTANPSPSSEPPKPFANFLAGAPMPTFGANSSAASAFGPGFIQSSTTSDKPPAPAPAPFVFGGGPPASTSASAPPVTAPGVFTFGAAKSEPKPAFTFGQNSAPGFSFGSGAPPPTLFGGFGQSKTENSLAPVPSVFGSPAAGVFGQPSAPAPQFEFGSSVAQQQDTKASPFQFGAASAQPASASGSQDFSLSVRPKFDFTGGQPTAFSAAPDAESPSVMRRNRKMIKAVRRTNRDPARRTQ